MRRIFLIVIPALALVVAYYICFGQAVPTMNAKGTVRVGDLYVPPAIPCYSTNTTLPYDTYGPEGFEDSAGDYYETTYAEFGTVANITAGADTSSMDTGKADGQCDLAWKIVVPTDGTETGVTLDIGSTIDLSATSLDLYCYLYIAAGPDTSGEVYYTLAADNDSNPGGFVAAVSLYNNTGNMQLRAAGSSTGTYETVNEDTWIKLKLHLDTTTNSCYLQIDDGAVTNTFSRYDLNVRYIHIGAVNALAANEDGTLYYDLVCGNTP